METKKKTFAERVAEAFGNAVTEEARAHREAKGKKRELPKGEGVAEEARFYEDKHLEK